MLEKIIRVIFRYEGGIADEGKLNVYDAAKAIEGCARSINIVNHAISNDGEIRKHADQAKGSVTYIHSSVKGCFEEQVEIHFNKKTIEKIGASVLTNIYWDYLQLAWASATGNTYHPQTIQLKKHIAVAEDFEHSIAYALESPMRDFLRPIGEDKNIKLIISGPRRPDVLTFSYKDYQYVSEVKNDNKMSYIIGNVTRFNVLSDFGRLYSDNDQKIVSFNIHKKDHTRVRNLVIKSMTEYVNDEKCKLYFYVSKVVGINGVIKRYIIHDIAEKRPE